MQVVVYVHFKIHQDYTQLLMGARETFKVQSMFWSTAHQIDDGDCL